ncbi:hypothetical protein SHELI_v1c01880 [Spiroplasma helicoides]|uniref:Uncharacterized protein n=1 Tax=Spiroplasma helicoides TaxID=216938 RepID=A0A1B3SJN0_9MOLU|nr:hypothetical protein [Spiroplasma helicoides]AOG60143.1 hypothetical protein SHELI_v1c01880 [Spiroplasma helicoides]
MESTNGVLLKENEKMLKSMYVISKKTFRNFILNMVLFLVLLLFVILNQLVFKENKKVQIIINMVCIGCMAYLIMAFTIIGWFSTEYYFKSLKVFDYKAQLSESKIEGQRIIELNSVGFILLNILISFISTLVFTYLMYITFEHYTDNKVWVEIGAISIHLLLIPAFVRMFETILEISNNYKKLLSHFLTTQFDSVKHLFEDAKFDLHSTHLKFESYNLRSRNNIFLINSDHYNENDKKIIASVNEVILENYKKLWIEYTKVYSLFRNLNPKENMHLIRKARSLLVVYLNIWNDFFIF